MADELFDQADHNKDQRLDLNEFRNFLIQNLGIGLTNFTANTTGGGQYTANSYEASSSAAYDNVSGANGSYGDVNSASGGYGGVTDLAGSTIGGTGTVGGEASYSSYEQSSYASSSAIGAGGFDENASSGVNLTGEVAGASSSSNFETSSSQQQSEEYADNPRGLYNDPNPQIIRRPAQGGQVTYTQNIKVRFLQPPAVPPPGPLIIKEVRPPQPPPPPPLRIRQQAPPLPPPPPLVLRERPPPLPASVAAQTVIRKLAALPPPPRSVIIERLPALPPKPRDIIIERWVPYGAAAKRKTIVQRAAAAKDYPKPRNVIILYEPIQVRVVRQFQRLGVSRENPQAYIQRYGTSLLEAQALLQQARAAGVVEDISSPNNAATVATSSSSFNAEFSNATSAIDTTDGINFASNSVGGLGSGVSGSTFESSNYSSGQQRGASFSGLESSQDSSLAGGFSSSHESSLFSSQNDAASSGVAFGGANASGFGGANTSGFGGASTSGYESYSASAGGVNGNNIDPATAAFNAADTNKDGVLDTSEFRAFLRSQLQNI